MNQMDEKDGPSGDTASELEAKQSGDEVTFAQFAAYNEKIRGRTSLLTVDGVAYAVHTEALRKLLAGFEDDFDFSVFSNSDYSRSSPQQSEQPGTTVTINNPMHSDDDGGGDGDGAVRRDGVQIPSASPWHPERPTLVLDLWKYDGTDQAEQATVDTLLESEAQVMITGFNITSEGAQVLLKRVKMTPLKRMQELLFKVTSLLTCGHPGVVGWLPLPGWVFGTEPQSCGGPVEVGFRIPSDTTTEADFDKLVISLKKLKVVSDNQSPSLVESGFTFTRICELSDGTAAGDDTLAAVIDFCSASRAPIPVDDEGKFDLFGL
jgi:hypothetical protein